MRGVRYRIGAIRASNQNVTPRQELANGVLTDCFMAYRSPLKLKRLQSTVVPTTHFFTPTKRAGEELKTHVSPAQKNARETLLQENMCDVVE
jgi:hypothetical protein